MKDKLQSQLGLARQFLQAGDHAAAEAALRKAVRIAPRHPDVLSELAFLLFGQRRLAEARDLLAKAAAFDSRNAERQANLATVCAELGDGEAAFTACTKALALNPRLQPALTTLARVHAGRGEIAPAAACFLRALAAGGERAAWAGEVVNYLIHHAELAANRGDLALADGITRSLAAIDPTEAAAWDRMAINFGLRQEFRRGHMFATRALRVVPGAIHILLNRAGLAAVGGMASAALADLAVAQVLSPDGWMVYANKAAVLDKAGNVAEALAETRRALAIAPGQLGIWGNLISMGMRSTQASPDRDARQFGLLVEGVVGPPPAVVRCRPGDRRLRIGYYSADFRRHSCAWFLEPLLRHHDRAAFEITAYAEVVAPDEVTARLQAVTERWRPTCGLDDVAVAEMVRQDGIDLLVDLAGHFTGGRPLLFARKPAPVQASWLGFNATTGLRAIDWKLVDRWLAPEGREIDWFAERLWRLPRLSHCWQPPAEAPAPDMSPDRPPSFGSFNALGKLSAETIALWARILRATPEARLVLKAEQSGDREVQRRLAAAFARHGIDPSRLTFFGYAGSIATHLALYREIDVALDPLPYNGTTTTCEALWMGVPVVSLAGDRLVARVGASLLSAIGLDRLVAEDEDGYVRVATALLADRGGLAAFRHGLRGQVASSSLRDEAGFARAMEDAYRGMIAPA